MKKNIMLSISIFILVILASCNTPEKAINFQDMDSKTFLEHVNLPENLSIHIDFDNVRGVDTAKTYKADHIVFDNQKLFIERLLYHCLGYAKLGKFIGSLLFVFRF